RLSIQESPPQPDPLVYILQTRFPQVSITRHGAQGHLSISVNYPAATANPYRNIRLESCQKNWFRRFAQEKLPIQAFITQHLFRRPQDDPPHSGPDTSPLDHMAEKGFGRQEYTPVPAFQTLQVAPHHCLRQTPVKGGQDPL